jgi:NitT/TauT family transport system ATP-binding protein
VHRPFRQGGMQEGGMTIIKDVRQDLTAAQRTGASKTGTIQSGAEQPVIQILSASKIFPNGTQALSPIELNVQQGEFLSLIGPSGCGKSTLLKMIANLIEPTDGRILWWNGGPGRIGSEGSRLAFVFQDPTLMPWARVDANVRLALDLERKGGNKSDADVAARIHAALDQVGLTKFARSYPRELSGGMRMRVSIARALIDQPDLLLMDEPFGALDEFTRNKLDLDLVRLSWERRLTTLFVTHSIYEAVFLSTRIVVMAANPGRIHSELVIDEPQPRDEDFRGSPRFAQLCRDLSRMLTEASNAGSPQS